MKLAHPFRTALIATLAVGLGILILQGIATLSTVLLYVGTALFLSLGLDPLISWMERHRLPRWAAVMIAILGVLGIVTGVVLMLVPIITNQISQLVQVIERLIARGRIERDIKEWAQGLFPNLDVDEVWLYVNDWFRELDLGSLGESFLEFTVSLLQGLTGTLIVLILTIYFTASMPNLKSAIYQLAPASKRPRFIDLAQQITDSVGHYVLGQVTLGAINGVLSAIFLNIIQAPFSAVLAVVAFFFSLIPLVGTLTGSTIIVLTCLIPGVGEPSTALIAAIYYLVYMQIEAYILSPRIMNRAVAVPGAVVVIAALAGGSLLGLLGALVAIPAAASVLIVYKQVVIPRMNER